MDKKFEINRKRLKVAVSREEKFQKSKVYLKVTTTTFGLIFAKNISVPYEAAFNKRSPTLT